MIMAYEDGTVAQMGDEVRSTSDGLKGGAMADLNNYPRFLQQKVRIDGGDVHGVVTAITMRPSAQQGELYITCEVSWIHNGQSISGWFELWRLEAC